MDVRGAHGGVTFADANPYDDVLRRYRTLVEQLPLVVYVDALDASSSNIFTSGQVERCSATRPTSG